MMLNCTYSSITIPICSIMHTLVYMYHDYSISIKLSKQSLFCSMISANRRILGITKKIKKID